MIYINNDRLNPAFNQALEEYLVKLDTTDAIFYLWRNEPAVICGKFQNIFEETNVPLAEKTGVKIVRRNTGGGTVYHDLGNVNYTFIAPKTENGIDYKTFMTPILSAIKNFGAKDAEITGICDISIDGLKISGSAQALIGNKILHHGTLLYDADLNALSALTRDVSKDAFISKAVKSVKVPVTNIKEHIIPRDVPRDVPCDVPSREEFIESVKNFVCGKDCVVRDISDYDTAAVEKLEREKYSSWDWNFGSSPRFSFDSSMSLESGKRRVKYSSYRGKIESIEVDGTDAEKINSALKDARLDAREIEANLIKSGISESESHKISWFITAGSYESKKGRYITPLI